MSQSDLAKALGITFQQVQKYERGSNRVSVGKLYRLADILDVPMMFFFDGLDAEGQRAHAGPDTPDHSGILSRRELDLLRAWRRAPPEVADTVSALLRALEPDMAVNIVRGAIQAMVTAPASQPVLATEPVLAEAAPATNPVVPEDAPRRRGRPLGSTNKKQDKPRRQFGAVWDPADIRSYED
ncbi:helix-turn-helix domain-containing protein [Niveispirillum fermenti]